MDLIFGVALPVLDTFNKMPNFPRKKVVLVGKIVLLGFLGSVFKVKIVLCKIDNNKRKYKNKKEKRPIHVNMLKELLFWFHDVGFPTCLQWHYFNVKKLKKSNTYVKKGYSKGKSKTTIQA